MRSSRVVFVGLIVITSLRANLAPQAHAASPKEFWVDAHSPPRSGARGTEQSPFGSLSEAIAKLPETLSDSVTIHVAPGEYATTGGRNMPAERLELICRMRPSAEVRIVGTAAADGSLPKFAWEGGSAMVLVSEGKWWIENVQIGTGTLRQRRGVMVTGPAQVTLKDVTFRTRSQSDAAIYAERGGLALLAGSIRINDDLHETAPEESFAGIIATDFGIVRFAERGDGLLDMGNGSLAASYYGCIGLGCRTARITSWGEQSNNLSINNSGRIDLHNTATTLCAKNKRNTPIGLEHDGHILAEDAHIIIEGENESAIALQKASTFTCNDIDLKGKFEKSLWASSGSMFVGRFLGDVTSISATTSARINIEKLYGQIRGNVEATHGGVVSLPDRTVQSK